MVIDPYSSQLNLYNCAGADNVRDSRKKKKNQSNEGRQIPSGVNIRSVWRILKNFNANRRVYLEWLWSPKKCASPSPKDKGYGKLVTDEEKRLIIRLLICFREYNL